MEETAVSTMTSCQHENEMYVDDEMSREAVEDGTEQRERGANEMENETAGTNSKKRNRKRNRPKHKQASKDGSADHPGASAPGVEPAVNGATQHPPDQHGPRDDGQRKQQKRDRPRSARGKSHSQSQTPQRMDEQDGGQTAGGTLNTGRQTSSRKGMQTTALMGGQMPCQTPSGKPSQKTGEGPSKMERPNSSKGRKNKNPVQSDGQAPSNETKDGAFASPTRPLKTETSASKNSRSTPQNENQPETPDRQKVPNGNVQTPRRSDLRGQRAPGSEAGGNQSTTPKSKKKTKTNKSKKFQPFEDYLSLEEVSHGLKRKELLQGTLRINPKNYEESYIDSGDGAADIMISGLRARNRALEGDVVVVRLLDKSAWRLLEDEYASHRRKKLQEAKSASPSESGTPKKSAATNSASEVDMALAGQLQGLEINSTDDKVPSSGVVDPSASESCRASKSMVVETDNSMFRVSGEEWQLIANNTTAVLESNPKVKNYQPGSLKEEIDQIVKKLFPDDGSNDKEGDEGGSRVEQEMEEIPKRFYQKHAEVVYIAERRHSRACSGLLKPPSSSNAPDALFSPTDHRMPRIYIPRAECPDGFLERPGDFETTLFIARLEEWPKTSAFARGHLHRSLGEAGEIEPETEGMLIEHGVDYSEFSDEVIDCLPKNLPWTIPPEEIDKRRDFRRQCVFTIDPVTARDLDDALSCVLLGDGIYEVGVHIADVSFFVDEGNALDAVASLRATSVFLVQKVIPMLPRLLCEHLCSLNPNEDKLTFSFLWKLTENGEILDEWCGRSIIRSCVKMSYDHAQGIIAEPDREWRDEEMPAIGNGFSIPEVAQGVLNLHKIAQNLRKKRTEDGALRLDQVKLQFALNKETGLPSGYSVYKQRDSNKLVEEFMLLANMAAAHRINDFNKKTALLRRHPPPKTKMIDDLIDMCSEIGLEVDGSSSKAIQESLSRYLGPPDDKKAWGMGQILTVLYSKPMQRAKYFCTGMLEDETLYRHFALNVPLYTHFTSPIRRYADIIVHRQLAASLGVGTVSERDEVSVQEQAMRCNERKEAAKKVSDMSGEMFFAIFVRECGPLEEDAMVMQVLDRAIDVLVLNLGVVKRVYCNALPLKSFQFRKEGKQGKLTLVWEADEQHPEEKTQTLRLFSLVKVVLEAGKEPLKYTANMKRPGTV